MIKYIIALLASKPEPYISKAQNCFSSCANGYILGEKSHPHITFSQFWASSNTEDLLKKEISLLSIGTPQLTGMSLIKDRYVENIWWAELSVARTEKLMHLAQKVWTLLERHSFLPLNDIGELYRPHLTLARVHNPPPITIEDSLLTPSPFVLSLGEADGIGQLVRIIHRF